MVFLPNQMAVTRHAFVSSRSAAASDPQVASQAGLHPSRTRCYIAIWIPLPFRFLPDTPPARAARVTQLFGMLLATLWFVGTDVLWRAGGQAHGAECYHGCSGLIWSLQEPAGVGRSPSNDVFPSRWLQSEIQKLAEQPDLNTRRERAAAVLAELLNQPANSSVADFVPVRTSLAELLREFPELNTIDVRLWLLEGWVDQWWSPRAHRALIDPGLSHEVSAQRVSAAQQELASLVFLSRGPNGSPPASLNETESARTTLIVRETRLAWLKCQLELAEATLARAQQGSPVNVAEAIAFLEDQLVGQPSTPGAPPSPTWQHPQHWVGIQALTLGYLLADQPNKADGVWERYLQETKSASVEDELWQWRALVHLWTNQPELSYKIFLNQRERWSETLSPQDWQLTLLAASEFRFLATDRWQSARAELAGAELLLAHSPLLEHWNPRSLATTENQSAVLSHWYRSRRNWAEFQRIGETGHLAEAWSQSQSAVELAQAQLWLPRYQWALLGDHLALGLALSNRFPQLDLELKLQQTYSALASLSDSAETPTGGPYVAERLAHLTAYERLQRAARDPGEWPAAWTAVETYRRDFPRGPAVRSLTAVKLQSELKRVTGVEAWRRLQSEVGPELSLDQRAQALVNAGFRWLTEQEPPTGVDSKFPFLTWWAAWQTLHSSPSTPRDLQILAGVQVLVGLRRFNDGDARREMVAGQIAEWLIDGRSHGAVPTGALWESLQLAVKHGEWGTAALLVHSLGESLNQLSAFISTSAVHDSLAAETFRGWGSLPVADLRRLQRAETAALAPLMEQLARHLADEGHELRGKLGPLAAELSSGIAQLPVTEWQSDVALQRTALSWVEALRQLGQPQPAWTLCEQLLAVAPHERRIQWLAGDLLEQLGSGDRAREHFQCLVSGSPVGSPAWRAGLAGELRWRCARDPADGEAYHRQLQKRFPEEQLPEFPPPPLATPPQPRSGQSPGTN